MSDPKAPEGTAAGEAGGAASVPASAGPTSIGPRRIALPLNALTLMIGDVVHVNVPLSHVVGHEQAEPRPWVIISDRARMHQHNLGVVIGVPLTRTDNIGKYREFRIRVPATEINPYDTRLHKIDS